MFAKLKQKIEESGTDLTKDLHTSSQRIGGAGSPLTSRRSITDNGRRQYGSNESLMSDSSTQNDVGNSSLKDLSAEFSGSPVARPGSSSRDVDPKIRELTRAFKEEVNKREKVERVLEKQQDLLARRIEEKDEEWKLKLASLMKENAQLSLNLSEANTWIEKFAKSHEVVEELDGFQSQEISKLKHLLLVTQQQLNAVNDAVTVKNNDLEVKTKLIANLTQENNLLKMKERIFLEENKTPILKNTEVKEEYEITNDSPLETESHLVDERHKYISLEKQMIQLQEECNVLRIQNECLLNKTAMCGELEEKTHLLEQQLTFFSINPEVDGNVKNNSKITSAAGDQDNDRSSAMPSCETKDQFTQYSLNDDLNEDIEIENCLGVTNSTEYKNLLIKLQDVESELNELRELNFVMKDRYLQLESGVSVFASEKETLGQQNKDLSSELTSVKENLRKANYELETTADQVKQLNDDLGLAESEKQNLLAMLAEFRETLKDAQNANSEANRLELLALNLQDQITEKNKTIKLQQQQINDMKKALQRELKLQSCLDTNSNDSSKRNVQLPKFSNSSNMFGSLQRDRPASLSEKLDDVNFKYVKHVVLKYMTSTESEAHHLIRAIGVLLDFTSEEEQLVRQTLDWKMSWFGSKPQLSRLHIGNRTIVS